jgi:CheY-like chemotaxis protein
VVERAIRLADPGVSGFHHAADGRAALDVLAQHWVDAIFCDLHMPTMTGREFIQTVRAHELWKNIPIAVLTSERSPETEEEVLALGANLYCMKPVAPETLRDLFEALKECMP